MRLLHRRFERLTEHLRRRWHAWLEHRADAAAFRDVDDATLRDLGVVRCEIASFTSEAGGTSERTRRRLARRRRPVRPRHPLPEM